MSPAEATARNYSGICSAACVISILILMVVEIPSEAAQDLLHAPKGAGASSHALLAPFVPTIGQHVSGTLGTILAYILICGAPLSSSLVLYFDRGASTEERPRQTRHSIWLSVLATISYMGYFGSTYHAGVLFLAILAWLLAVLHARDLTWVEAVAEKSSARLGDVNRQLVEQFYDEFFTTIRTYRGPNRKRLRSVERRWTGETRVWVAIDAKHLGGQAAQMQATINYLEQRSLLLSALKQTDDALFIGPMPWRRAGAGFDDDQFLQLLALIYTSCICEIAKRQQAAKLGQAGKLRVCIGDVSSWVKIVGDTYWVLQGPPGGTILAQRFPLSQAPSKLPNAQIDSGDLREYEQHYSRLGANLELIDASQRNARGAYEHVFSLMLNAAASLGGSSSIGFSATENVSTVLNKLVDRIYSDTGTSDESAIDAFVKRKGSSLNHAATADHVYHLFRLFLALCFDGGGKLDGHSLSRALTSVTFGQIWRRIA